MKSKIIFLHNNEIDLLKWDQVVYGAPNSRIYAESWYLDIIDPDWQGLIFGDYDYVMPIISSSKFGIKYAYQPAYAQQHGIFPPSTPEITTQFILKLKSEFRYFNISLNSLNNAVEEQVSVEYRKNFILSLNHDETELKKNYNSHAKRYVRKAYNSCVVAKNISLEDFINLKIANSSKKVQKLFVGKLKLIISKALATNKGVIYGAYTQHNELCAAAFFLKEKKRFTYINSISRDDGKQNRAMYAIVDQFIIDQASQPFLLDFEGSNIDGIARFFKGFGASLESYQHIKYNDLPWYMKLIKK